MSRFGTIRERYELVAQVGAAPCGIKRHHAASSGTTRHRDGNCGAVLWEQAGRLPESCLIVKINTSGVGGWKGGGDPTAWGGVGQGALLGEVREGGRK